jgi:hypothetical protein
MFRLLGFLMAKEQKQQPLMGLLIIYYLGQSPLGFFIPMNVVTTSQRNARV